MAYAWRSTKGDALTCSEKLATLESGMQELEQQCRDMLDDALLMGCSQDSAKAALRQLIEGLAPTVKERS